MRLIDADALLKELESNKLQPTKDTDGFIDGWCEGFNTVVDMIRKQPTAFDMEKVVAELESARNCHYSNKWDEEGDLVLIKSIESNIAIDIVKKGGVE